MARLPRREDPIFGGLGPLLFAHRGGAEEAPESTEQAFRWALDHGADVLELDVQRTRDGTFVVWHGPGLENVLIDHEDAPPEFEKRTEAFKDIGQASWSDLRGRAWVRSPVPSDPDYSDIRDVPRVPDRQLLSLADFLERFPDAALNIEIKGDNCGPEHVEHFWEVLEPRIGQRKVLVVTQSNPMIDRFRELSEERVPTGLSLPEVLRLRVAPAPGTGPRLEGRALQSTHLRLVTRDWMIRRMRNEGGATHVFITQFMITSGLDDDEKGIDREDLFDLLDRGADGIMTDRPARVRTLIDEWISREGA